MIIFSDSVSAILTLYNAKQGLIVFLAAGFCYLCRDVKQAEVLLRYIHLYIDIYNVFYEVHASTNSTAQANFMQRFRCSALTIYVLKPPITTANLVLFTFPDTLALFNVGEFCIAILFGVLLFTNVLFLIKTISR